LFRFFFSSEKTIEFGYIGLLVEKSTLRKEQAFVVVVVVVAYHNKKKKRFLPS